MLQKTKKFDCGCEFPLDENGKVILPTDIEELNLECPRIWQLLADGKTTGIFQLESRLGSSYAKKLKPKDLEAWSLLIAAIRPGCLEVKVDDKTVTQHLVDRYNHQEDLSYIHIELEDILKETLGFIVYQESALLITQKLAGFTLEQADLLRRAIGHKEVETMEKIKQPFLDGCKKVGKVNEQDAIEIFNMIAKSQRYSFNKCLSLDTVVETINGYKTLVEVCVGDCINSPEGYVEVLNKYDNGIKDVYEVTLESGKTIQCTIDHQFLCNDGKKHPLYKIMEKNLKIIVEHD